MADPVRFVVGLKKGVNGHSVKPDLEALASDISIHVLDLTRLHMQYVTGSTSQATYEQVFGAKLDSQTKTVYDLAGNGSSQQRVWVELTPAAVPQTLQDRIAHIYLEKANT